MELGDTDLDSGFHNRDGWFFKRESGGVVRILKLKRDNMKWIVEAGPHYIPENEWSSIVCSVSSLGETFERWNHIREFHK